MNQLPIKAAVSRDRTRMKLYVLVLCLDIALMTSMFGFANLAVVGAMIQNGKPHGLVMVAMIAPAYVLLAIHGGALGIRMIGDAQGSAFRAVLALAQASLLTLLVIYLGKISSQLSRMTFVLGVLTSAAGIAAIRFAMSRYATVLFGEMPQLVTIITDGAPAPNIAGAMVFDASALGIDPSDHDADMASRLAATVCGAERVIVSCSADRMDQWSMALQSLEARGEIILPELLRFAPATVADFEGHPTIVVAGGPMQFRDRIVKRIMDLAMAGIAALFLVPLICLTAIAIKFTSPGPILFRQQRMGRDAHPFTIFKFRTMRTDMTDHAADQLTERNDPRITRIGAFLRRSSLDELPQLFNVLRGDMSIVGPRPHAAAAKAADQLYWEVDPRYWGRHCIKPGMTGLAQVRGHRGATHEREDLVNRLQSDLEYVTKWSIWRDLQIMVQTLAVLFHKNAY